MNTRMIVPALLGAVMISLPAVAADSALQKKEDAKEIASMTQAEQCARFKVKFDEALESRQNAAKAGQARAMRDEGGKLCDAGRYADGISKLQGALGELGVK